MIYHSKTITLKNGQSVILRSPAPADASQMLIFLKHLASDTDYLIRYPEECESSSEKEAKLIGSVRQSEYDLYIAAFAENKIAVSYTHLPLLTASAIFQTLLSSTIFNSSKSSSSESPVKS